MAFRERKIKAEVSSLGREFKRARLKLGLSVEECEAETKLRVAYLEAIEAGRFHLLPSGVYSLGYVQSYAKFLGLPVNRITARYRASLELRSKNESPILPARQVERKSLLLTPRLITLTVLGLIFLVIVGYVLLQVSQFVGLPELELVEPSGLFLASNSNTVEVSGKTSPQATILINGEPIRTDGEGNFKETVSVPPGFSKLTIKAVNRFDRQRSITLTVQAPEIGSKEPLFEDGQPVEPEAG